MVSHGVPSAVFPLPSPPRHLRELGLLLILPHQDRKEKRIPFPSTVNKTSSIHFFVLLSILFEQGTKPTCSHCSLTCTRGLDRGAVQATSQSRAGHPGDERPLLNPSPAHRTVCASTTQNIRQRQFTNSKVTSTAPPTTYSLERTFCTAYTWRCPGGSSRDLAVRLRFTGQHHTICI
ncbi:hypothetical protein M011DRAFT_125898 [Sporormia fimetaria CBS 119925]|uniref:Uncharacterized protein n=1 Tax=Sporormia fimetaria CBS 119925 TaxID=1340428 RepID=A0A6A6V8A7_9PLEO|nr:hypothetical protein M011DRAFT_125898 [Sporormia fimetaria CBS 119925]